MTDPYEADTTGRDDATNPLGDPDKDSTWNTLTGLADADDLLNEDDFANFLMEPERDPEGILADTVDQVAPGAFRLDEVDTTMDRTFTPDDDDPEFVESSE